ncbi:hypothetical protein E4U55_002878 [Claviceps digitariae]|nr:hypothetical protein E4U55_002878 [Claviceps digitariae]
MASHQPVPSRAALYALRGAFLTTSCSIILLVEERRRRLQIARATIDNARTLHSLQKNRGPIPLAECHTIWNSRAADVDDDALSMASLPRPRTSTRRRGRTQLMESDQARESCEHDSWQTQPVSSRVESHNQHTEPSRATHFLGNDLITSTFEKLSATSSWSNNRNQLLNWRHSQRDIRFKKSSDHVVAPAVLHANSTYNKVSVALTTTKSQDTMAADEPANNTCSLEAAQRYLQKAEHGNLVSRPYYDDAIPVLERLLTELETPTTDKDMHLKKINVVKTIFDRIVLFGPLPKAAQPLEFQAIRLFHILARSCPEDITATLWSLLSLNKKPMNLLLQFTRVLQRRNHDESLRGIFLFLSRGSHGELVCRWLTRFAFAQAQHDFVLAKQLYLKCQAFGLFREIKVAKLIEYQTRKLIIILALRAEENDFASTELRKLWELDPQRIMFDTGMQKLVIAKKASIGKWDQVWRHIEDLLQNHPSVGFLNLLSSVTDIFAKQCRDHDELEAFLRKMVTVVAGSKFRIQPRWFYAVLDGHASRRRLGSVLSWLRFCGENGLWANTKFNKQFLDRCRNFWSFSDKGMRCLEAMLNAHGLPHGLVDRSLVPKTSRRTIPKSSLKQAVLEQLECDPPNVQGARRLIDVAHKEGCDVSRALTCLLTAQFKLGHDPTSLIKSSLQSGLRLHDSVYNMATQAVAAEGHYAAAVEICRIAARENGNGQLLYNQYNFANLVFAHTGHARYTALQSVLSAFTSEARWWHGTPVCKEAIKLAMKVVARRVLVDTKKSNIHRKLLEELNIAFWHVKKCRISPGAKVAISEAYVGAAIVPPLEALRKGQRQLPEEKSGDAGPADAAGNTPVDGGHSEPVAASESV